MGMWVGRGRKARAAYGFDDIALVPGALTINPNEVDISWELCGRRFDIPIIAAAMDGVVSPSLAIEMGRLGGLAVINLEGIFSRYENPGRRPRSHHLRQPRGGDEDHSGNLRRADQGRADPPAHRGDQAGRGTARRLRSRSAPSASRRSPERRVRTSSSCSPPSPPRATCAADRAGRPRSCSSSICRSGDCRQRRQLRGLTRADGDRCPRAAHRRRPRRRLHLARGPRRSACRRSRRPSIPRRRATSTSSGPAATCRSSRTAASDGRRYLEGAGLRRRRGDDGLPLRRAKAAPGLGYRWGMATPHSNLPRGTRIRVGIAGPLEQILFGPAFTEDGTLNLVGAIRTCMGSVGARSIRELQQTGTDHRSVDQDRGEGIPARPEAGRPALEAAP